MSPQPAFEHALSLTAEADYHGLSTCLLQLIRPLPLVQAAEIYEVFNKDGDQVHQASDMEQMVIRHFSRLLQSDRPVLDEYGLFIAISKGETAELRSPDDYAPGIRLIYPVPSDLGPMRLLVIDGDSGFAQQRASLQQLVDLYRNLVRLHDSRERDLLTGLQNRQTFDNNMLKVMDHLRKIKQGTQPQQAWLAVLDIDHFKRINDNFGHLYGDEVLLRFAQLIKKWFRSSDLAFRFGGEEFIVLMAKASETGAIAGLNRFREAVAQHDFGKVGQVTVSIGFVRLECSTLPSTLIDQADQALYQAKHAGRNRIVQYQPPETAAEADDDIELFD
ncbi:MAG: GGDEF domain-containing protein [Gammaproteobacteria bacterium]|nr:GGDEF domain-containing protein [Gammaproteobacteria bacterium]